VLTPKLALLVQRAQAEEHRLVQARSPSSAFRTRMSWSRVERLTDEMERIAQRAQLVATYLSEQRPEDVRRRVHELRRQQGGSDETVRRRRERTVDALTNQVSVLAGAPAPSSTGSVSRWSTSSLHSPSCAAKSVRMTVAGEGRGPGGRRRTGAGAARAGRRAISEGISEAVGQLEP
jgi:hypothetical protein